MQGIALGQCDARGMGKLTAEDLHCHPGRTTSTAHQERKGESSLSSGENNKHSSPGKERRIFTVIRGEQQAQLTRKGKENLHCHPGRTTSTAHQERKGESSLSSGENNKHSSPGKERRIFTRGGGGRKEGRRGGTEGWSRRGSEEERGQGRPGSDGRERTCQNRFRQQREMQDDR